MISYVLRSLLPKTSLLLPIKHQLSIHSYTIDLVLYVVKK